MPSQPARVLTTNNLALSADSFYAIGDFNTTFARTSGEDGDFCDRWLQQGHRLIYTLWALLYHAHDLTLRTFWL
jgi:GT2 family glycosyltransferase